MDRDESLSVTGLRFTYKSWTEKQNQAVFTDLNFTVRNGEHILLLAEPGAGKTTLSRIVTALIPKFADGQLSGKILVCGKDISKIEPYDLIRDICYISQDPSETIITATVENEIAFPLESMGMEKRQIVDRVNISLAKWGLSDLADANPTELSGGERKRMVLAVAFAIDPAILFLDESFDDLDAVWRKKLAYIIEESNKTIIVLSARYLPQFDFCLKKSFVLTNGKLSACSNAYAKNIFTHQSADYYIAGSKLLTPRTERIAAPILGKHILQASSLTETRYRKNGTSKIPFVLSCRDFRVQTGEIVRLTGDNGSGKTTLSRLLCGLDRYETGQIQLDEELVSQDVLNANVGYLFQNPDLQIFLPTVFEELAWGLQNAGLYSRKEIQRRVTECADLFGLNSSDTPATMSFALRKKLQAAVYYLLARPFLILDELDGAMSYNDAYFIIDQLNKQGSALIIITHDDFFARDIVDKTYHVNAGQVQLV